MKTIFRWTLLSIIIIFFLCESCSKNDDIVVRYAPNMFKNYQSIKITKKIDYIGLSFHYEIYDVSIYQVINGEINPDFCFDVLTGTTENVSNKSWLRCNSDNTTAIYFPVFDTKNKYRKEVITNIDNGLSDDRNWYYCIITNDLNHLFLFCPNNNLLYYVQWNV